MGTTFSVIYQGNKNLKAEIDNLLIDINDEVSTYIPSSIISKYNQSDSIFLLDTAKHHFLTNWITSKEIYAQTRGFFDPTVMPLTNYWGFGYSEKVARTEVDSMQVKEMMKGVGLNKIKEKDLALIKPTSDAQLDFSAIAKGYAVDAIAHLLNNSGSRNYLVEVGREVYAKGVSVKGEKWKIGISTPVSEAALDDISMVLELTKEGVASSGNYRNFYIVEGKKYGHTLDPHTGYPSLNELLGTTVISDDCMTADAYATAFMSMGLVRASKQLEQLEGVNACFFYSDQNGNILKKYSDGFIQYIAGDGE